MTTNTEIQQIQERVTQLAQRQTVCLDGVEVSRLTGAVGLGVLASFVDKALTSGA